MTTIKIKINIKVITKIIDIVTRYLRLLILNFMKMQKSIEHFIVVIIIEISINFYSQN